MTATMGEPRTSGTRNRGGRVEKMTSNQRKKLKKKLQREGWRRRRAGADGELRARLKS